MSPHEKHAVTSEDVISRIKSEIASPSRGQTTSSVASRIARIRSMQRDLRIEPLGGRLLPVKKLVHWFVASTFDRQAKVIEALLDVVRDIGEENEQLRGQLRRLMPEMAGHRDDEGRSGGEEKT